MGRQLCFLKGARQQESYSESKIGEDQVRNKIDNIDARQDLALDMDLALEMLGHSCVLGAWLCLNCMGHHVWKVIRSKSVFTRVTDGQRCCYYSLYVILGTGLVSGTATAAHFLVGRQEGYGEFKVGPASLAIFYAPVLFLLLVNVFFWWTATRQIGKQLVYNRSMQH